MKQYFEVGIIILFMKQYIEVRTQDETETIKKLSEAINA